MLQRTFRATPGRPDIQGLLLLESCSFRWIFDVAAHRFRRSPRDARVWLEPDEMWTEYHALHIDDSRSCFVVELDAARTHTLRAWLHTDPCDRCGRDAVSSGDRRMRLRS
jgi:hypothetical protein